MVVVDDYDIVNRIADSSVSAPGGRGAANRAPAREPRLELTADEALLFRFSALTYNSHRIHYDHNWARQEGYADLVVHGPLQALMMGELVRRSACGLVGRTFHYRLVSPMIGAQTFTVATERRASTPARRPTTRKGKSRRSAPSRPFNRINSDDV